MLRKKLKENMFETKEGWLESRFHFSFAHYRDVDNMNFGVLRVLNDDIIQANSGFDIHPHHDMEIISYVVDGEITHKDSMGNEESLSRGEVQYLSAGTGIMHCEYNMDSIKDLRLLQIWIIPPKKNINPLYGSHRYKSSERKNNLLNIVSPQNGNANVKIHQDVNFYVSELDMGKNIDYEIQNNRQVYFVQIEGKCKINNIELNAGDAMKITKENHLDINAQSDAHFLFIEMAES
jgi:redox-sensitive bicupin YhaK (pirin superfamily)